MIPIFGYGKINASSSAVESEMNDVKHVLLKNMSRPMRADKFITRHLSSFTGKALLAMSTRNELLPSVTDNAQITGNNEQEISMNETEPISLSTSKNNLPENILVSPNESRKSKLTLTLRRMLKYNVISLR